MSSRWWLDCSQAEKLLGPFWSIFEVVIVIRNWMVDDLLDGLWFVLLDSMKTLLIVLGRNLLPSHLGEFFGLEDSAFISAPVNELKE